MKYQHKLLYLNVSVWFSYATHLIIRGELFKGKMVQFCFNLSVFFSVSFYWKLNLKNSKALIPNYVQEFFVYTNLILQKRAFLKLSRTDKQSKKQFRSFFPSLSVKNEISFFREHQKSKKLFLSRIQ